MPPQAAAHQSRGGYGQGAPPPYQHKAYPTSNGYGQQALPTSNGHGHHHPQQHHGGQQGSGGSGYGQRG